MTAAAASYIAPSVAALALLFTVATFWWLQLRRGDLRAIEPETYSGFVGDSSFRLRLALTLTNTGAKDIPVVDLRLKIDGEERTAPSQTFRSTVRPLPNGEDIADVAHPFTVPGRETTVKIVEFGSSDWAPLGDALDCTIEARTEKPEWTSILQTRIELPDEDDARRRYLAHHRTAARGTGKPASNEGLRDDGVVCPACGALGPPGSFDEVCAECGQPSR